MAFIGQAMVQGKHGVAKNEVLGIFELGRAAGVGVDYAYYSMGNYLRRGRHGVPQDAQAARKMYGKMATAKVHCTRQEVKDKIAKWLEETS